MVQYELATVEWVGVGLGFCLYVVGIAELTGLITVLPVPAYIVALVLLTILLWLSRT